MVKGVKKPPILIELSAGQIVGDGDGWWPYSLWSDMRCYYCNGAFTLRVRSPEADQATHFCRDCGHLNLLSRSANTVTLSRPPVPAVRIALSALGGLLSLIFAFVTLTINVATSDIGGIVGTLVLAPGHSANDAVYVREMLRFSGFVWICISIAFFVWLFHLVQLYRHIRGISTEYTQLTLKPETLRDR